MRVMTSSGRPVQMLVRGAVELAVVEIGVTEDAADQDERGARDIGAHELAPRYRASVPRTHRFIRPGGAVDHDAPGNRRRNAASARAPPWPCS